MISYGKKQFGSIDRTTTTAVPYPYTATAIRVEEHLATNITVQGTIVLACIARHGNPCHCGAVEGSEAKPTSERLLSGTNVVVWLRQSLTVKR